MNPTLTLRAKPADEVLFQALGDEAVLLSLASERYFSLDPVGTRIWTLLVEDPSLRQAFATLCAEYDVEPDRLETDLLELIGQLAEAGLVQVS
jgi:hypothetical protein